MSGRVGPRASVIGGGAWGTALAAHLARGGERVGLWMREADLVSRMRERRDNPAYLPGVRVPPAVEATGSLAEALEGADLVLLAVPSPFARAVYREMAPLLSRGVPLVVATKGIEQGTLALPSAVAGEEMGNDRPRAILSGPSFAEEVARGHATAVVIASEDSRLARDLRDRISGASLRLYANADPVGVQLAGALKNVIAIAAGMLEGLRSGHNTLAALVTRGLAEISRLGGAMGADPATFSGLAGLGDLVLTCTSDLSRNRRVGAALGRGERLQDVLARTAWVAEGVPTARSARMLASRLGVEMPIVEEVHRILYEDGAPGEAIRRLMARPLTSEKRLPEELGA